MTGSKEEHIVMLALYLSSNGLLCKIGNSYINIPASTFLCILAKYISYIAKNTNNGLPFIKKYSFDNKKRKNWLKIDTQPIPTVFNLLKKSNII